MTGTVVRARGPYFDELERGEVFDAAPPVTLTAGGAAVHQMIVGDRLRYATDHVAGARLTGRGPVAHPAYVWDVAIGQSTQATHFVRANLFYRGLRFLSFPVLGDTLHTRTTVVGLRENTRRPGRGATGLAALRIQCVDQRGAAVLDFHRCAMLPLSPDAPDTGHQDDLSGIGTDAPSAEAALQTLDLTQHRTRTPPEPGTTIEVVGGDVVSSAPELARLTLNVAQVHHDAGVTGRRLVYGGHTIGLAAAQVARAFPDLVAFLGWESCDHTGPVHEGDTLRSTIDLLSARPGPSGSVVAQLRVRVTAEAGNDVPRDVLDWRCEVLT
ncbi:MULTISPECIES: MaoC family dehydratase [Amycolatopsis]|uniref:Acyl dehydratase n=1 Tax=Amycolatopsis echigonensis TaxID=2576905 RepID=A0A2N3WNA3_9PSEU|nr:MULTISPECIES: MaoC family dehydratase [Amycolatopsis]PKV95344.1 acyl dehydratase [Amycolatopsis niigatensis]